jgi:hypothetical protein
MILGQILFELRETQVDNSKFLLSQGQLLYKCWINQHANTQVLNYTCWTYSYKVLWL